MAELPIAPVGRLIKQSGAFRVSEGASETLADILDAYAKDVSSYAAKLAQHAGRKTVTAEDIELAAKTIVG